jgi:AsmA protein
VSTPVRIVLILFALLVLALGGIATFLLTLDPERYRDEITQLVRDRTGLHVRLDGPITWSIWPSISLGVDDAAADWTDAGKDAE